MIARIWRGATRAEDAESYLEYLNASGFPGYRDAAGNRGLVAMRRIKDGRAEFLLLTLWDSDEAIRRFAGDDPGRAVFYPEDERFLVERGERVEHYQVVYQTEESPR